MADGLVEKSRNCQTLVSSSAAAVSSGSVKKKYWLLLKRGRSLKLSDSIQRSWKSANACAACVDADQILGMESENLYESQKNYALGGEEWKTSKTLVPGAAPPKNDG